MEPRDPVGPHQDEVRSARRDLLNRDVLKEMEPRKALAVAATLLLVLATLYLSRRPTPVPRPTARPAPTDAPVTALDLKARAGPGRPPAVPTIETATDLGPAAPSRLATRPARTPRPRRPTLRVAGLAPAPAPYSRHSVRPAEPSDVKTVVRPEPDRLRLKRNRVIHARLERAIDSAGFESAVVARIVVPVFDERGLLIFPELTELHGTVARDPVLGSNRVGILWHEAVLPSAWGSVAVPLDLPGADGAGVEGLEAKVSFRWASFYGHAALLSVVGGLAQAAQEPEGGNARFGAYAIGEFSRRSADVTDSVLRRLEDRRPRYRVERGTRIAVQVTRTLEVVYR